MRELVQQTCKILGFDDVLAAVSGYAASELGRRAVLDLKPASTAGSAKAALTLVYEWTGLLARSFEPPMAGVSDVSASLSSVGVAGSLLEAERLCEIGAFAAAAENLRAYFSKHRDAAPHCWDLASRIAPAPKTREAVSRAIAPPGEVLDDASPLLRRIRREWRDLDARLTGQLQKMAAQLHKDGALAEDFYTQRNGRYVLPVKAGSRGRVQGIVHDASNSGQTLFIEPLAVVEMSNELTALQFQEADEIRRILIELCDIVREELPALQADLALLAEIDSIYARARFGLRNDLAIPRLIEGAALELKGAHHPLLYLVRRDASIPINVSLDDEDRVLMISGPNAGGKTTALKTIGLQCMMAQSGIPVPANANSIFPVFSQIFADIGDEQDVQAGLSTFSSHIQTIRRILDAADERSLALLDELGTATDPTEGGSLAVAIAERLCQRAALTVITSHLAVLKNWAHEESRARNSSFNLDETTLQPAFVLTMDVPGASEALVVAEQQGLDHALIERARELLPAGQEDVSSLILSLQRKNEDMEAMKKEEEERLALLEADRDRYQRLYEQYHSERKNFKKGVLEEKKRILDAARAEIERRIANLPAVAASAIAADRDSGKDALKQARQEMMSEQRQAEAEIEALAEPPAPPEAIAHLSAGAAIVVEGMSDPGVIVEMDAERGRAKVMVKGLTMELPLTRLRPATVEEANIVKDRKEGGGQRRRGVRVVKRPDSDIKLELDLHGMYVEEAVELTDQYLSDAAIHDARQVRIMHGTGTGRLRRGIHAFLKTHPLVKHFRYGLPNEGGAGVTVVELRE